MAVAVRAVWLAGTILLVAVTLYIALIVSVALYLGPVGGMFINNPTP